METKVFKFGGSSVRDAERIANVKDILLKHSDEKVVVVISAMGKNTNALENVHQLYIKEEEAGLQALDKVLDQHVDLASELGLDAFDIESKLQEFIIDNISSISESDDEDEIYGQIISLGELFSTTIITSYLQAAGILAKWMDVRNVMSTSADYREAKVDFQLSKNKISKKVKKYMQKSQFVVTQGFIGREEGGMTTTLGREGSDYTAAIFAYAMDVEELTIWKDVEGVLTADPRRFENVELLEKISYREAIEMTYYGAKVIHPKTIQPIQNKSIKLYVRSFLDLEKPGTLIADPGLPNYPPIIVIQEGIILLQITTKNFSFIEEDHLSIIFNKMKEYKVKLCIMRNSAISFTLCINPVNDDKLEAFIKALGKAFQVEIFRNLQLITIRHFKDGIIEKMTRNKVILFEETLKDTIQLVVRPTLELKEKENL